MAEIKVLPTSRRPSPVLALLVLLVWTACLYASVHDHDFVHYDDPIYVFENSQVQGGLSWASLRWAFGFHAANWHPLTWISHMADASIFGPGASGAQHLVNLAWHLANVVLVFLLGRQLFSGLAGPWFVAAVLALHPLHVESVAWISERKDLLSSFFGLCCLLAYLRYARTLRPLDYLFVVLALALSLLSKPMLVTAPFLLLILDWWPLRRIDATNWRRRVVEKLPLLLLAIASCIATWFAQRQGGAMAELPLLHRCLTGLHAYAGYLLKFIWPHPLAPLYPNHLGMWSIASTLLATLALSALTLLVWRWRQERALWVGWLWYLGTLVPVLGLVQVGRQSMADRYTYLPLVGICIGLVAAYGLLLGAHEKLRRPLRLATLALLLAWSALTRAQVELWRDSETLFSHALAVTKENDIMQNNWGAWLVDQGRADEAVAYFREAVRIRPDFEDAQWNLGRTLMQLQRAEEAIPPLEAAVRIRPDRADMRIEYARALRAVGRVDAALAQLQVAVRIDPGSAPAWNNLGNALGSLRRFDEAIACFRRALQLDPNYATAHQNLALACESIGDVESARHHLIEALRLDPNSETARAALQRLPAPGDR